MGASWIFRQLRDRARRHAADSRNTLRACRIRRAHTGESLCARTADYRLHLSWLQTRFLGGHLAPTEEVAVARKATFVRAIVTTSRHTLRGQFLSQLAGAMETDPRDSQPQL